MSQPIKHRKVIIPKSSQWEYKIWIERVYKNIFGKIIILL